MALESFKNIRINREDMLALTRRMNVKRTSITRIAGAYIDSDGKVNTYEAYLRDLKLAHTIPIMISEFGVPTSRGVTHKNVMGYNQGGVDETEQGDMLADMYISIYDSGYAGAIAFSWQDEWFKRTWNNSKGRRTRNSASIKTIT